MADYSMMAGGPVGLLPQEEEPKGLLDRIASGINKAYSDPGTRRGLTSMGMALMDAAGPRPIGQRMNTGQMLARGFAGYQQGKDAYAQEQARTQDAMLKRAALMQKLQGDAQGADVDRLKLIQSYRKEIDKPKQEFSDLIGAFDSLKSVAMSDNPNPYSDVAIITGFAKALDPTSVVRTEEGEQIVKSGGIFDTLRNYADQIQGNAQLQPGQRKQILEAAYNAMSGKAANLGKRFEGFRDNVVMPLGEQYVPQVFADPRLLGYQAMLDKYRGDIQGWATPSPAGSGGPSKDKRGAIARGQELEDEGKTDDEIEAILRKEGYIQ